MLLIKWRVGGKHGCFLAPLLRRRALAETGFLRSRSRWSLARPRLFYGEVGESLIF